VLLLPRKEGTSFPSALIICGKGGSTGVLPRPPAKEKTKQALFTSLPLRRKKERSKKKGQRGDPLTPALAEAGRALRGEGEREVSFA